MLTVRPGRLVGGFSPQSGPKLAAAAPAGCSSGCSRAGRLLCLAKKGKEDKEGDSSAEAKSGRKKKGKAGAVAAAADDAEPAAAAGTPPEEEAASDSDHEPTSSADIAAPRGRGRRGLGLRRYGLALSAFPAFPAVGHGGPEGDAVAPAAASHASRAVPSGRAAHPPSAAPSAVPSATLPTDDSGDGGGSEGAGGAPDAAATTAAIAAAAAGFAARPAAAPLPAARGADSITDSIRDSGNDSGNDAANDWLDVGYVLGGHGLKGELRVKPTTDSPSQRLSPSAGGGPPPLWLRPPPDARLGEDEPSPLAVRVTRGRPAVSKRGGEAFIVGLAGVSTRSQADALRGAVLVTKASARPVLSGDDEFYTSELVGMACYEVSSGLHLGVVCDVYKGTGTHDLLQVKLVSAGAEGQEGRLALVPFVRAIAPVVDLPGRRIGLAPPPGLLALARVHRASKPDAAARRRARREAGAGGGAGVGGGAAPTAES